MKKYVLALFAAAIALASQADPFEVNGKFEKINKKTGRPVSWNFNAWNNYKPHPKVEVITAEGESATMHIFDIQGKRGTELYFAKPQPALPGDTITITAKIKGKGTVTFGIQLRDEKNNYLGYIKKGGSKKLTEEWQEVKVSFKVVNATKGPTKNIYITFGCNSGNEIFIKDLVAEHTAAAPAAAAE